MHTFSATLSGMFSSVRRRPPESGMTTLGSHSTVSTSEGCFFIIIESASVFLANIP